MIADPQIEAPQPADAALFDTQRWWSEEDFLFGLHTLLDPLRVPYFADRLDPSWRVLDVGCGGGFLTVALTERGFDVVGIDLAEQAIAAARRKAKGRFVVGDAHTLPFPPECFDAVICSEVLEHVLEPRRVVAECSRVLTPGGSFLFSGPNRTRVSWLALIGLAQRVGITRVLPPDLHRWNQFVEIGELRALLEDRWITIEDVDGVGIAAKDLPSALAALAALRIGRLNHGEAGRRIRLTASASTAFAYIGSAIKASAAREKG